MYLLYQSILSRVKQVNNKFYILANYRLYYAMQSSVYFPAVQERVHQMKIIQPIITMKVFVYANILSRVQTLIQHMMYVYYLLAVLSDIEVSTISVGQYIRTCPQIEPQKEYSVFKLVLLPQLQVIDVSTYSTLCFFRKSRFNIHL